jgi:hypothetical protein
MKSTRRAATDTVAKSLQQRLQAHVLAHQGALMTCYRVTHIDAQRCRRRMRVQAADRAGAVAWVEQLYGDAWYVAAVREGGGR